MNFGITTHKQQQHRQQKQQRKASDLTAAITASSSGDGGSSPNYQANSTAFQKTLTTAQNFFINNRPQQPQHYRSSPTSQSGLMSKSIENATRHTDSDENDEKDKENINMLHRRESLSADASAARLNTIHEAAKDSKSITTQPLLTSLNLKTLRFDASSPSPSPSSSSVSVTVSVSASASASVSALALPSSLISTSASASTTAAASAPEVSTTPSSSPPPPSSSNTTTTTTPTTSSSAISAAAAATTSVQNCAAEEIAGQQACTSSDPASRQSGTESESRTVASTDCDTPGAAETTEGAAESEATNNSLSTTNESPSRKSSISSTRAAAEGKATPGAANAGKRSEEDSVSKSSDTSGELIRGSTPSEPSGSVEKSKSSSRLSERAKKKSWYNVLYPNYKSRSQDFKKLFKEVSPSERLIVDYSCALQRDILVQGRLYVSQNYLCFHANIFGWETYLTLKWKDITSITKEKTALVIPNAISICTAKDKYFFATFTSRDKAFLMLFRVWQNTLMNKPMLPQEMWKWVHNCYGDELGLTTDDEDYIDPTSVASEFDIDTELLCSIEETSLAALTPSDLIGSATIRTPSIPINPQQRAQQQQQQQSATSNSSGSGQVTRSRALYFFSSSKSNPNSSNASASGSDNNNKESEKPTRHIPSRGMDPNAKELTLTSVSPDEQSAGDIVGTNGTDIATTDIRDSKRRISKNNRQRDESCSKTKIDTLPTDASDSSDSEETKIPFVATTECTSTHEGRQLMHTILPINIDTLFNLLYTKSKFLTDFHAMRKSTDCEFGEWTTNASGQKVRLVNITVQLGGSVGPKTARVTEEQVLRDCSKPGEMYSIDINSGNSGIPYADAFCVSMHHCLVRTVDDHTMMSVHAQIMYKKSVWGVIKGFIEKNAWAGLEDFYTALLHALQNETCIPPAKGKGRRPRRGTTSQARPLEEPVLAQVKLEPDEKPIPFADAPQAIATVAEMSAAHADQKKYMWLAIFVVTVIIGLMVLNVILLFKLRTLEDRVDRDIRQRQHLPNLANLKELPTAPKDWLKLLREQEILHETELKRWHTVLQTAIDLLKKTEKTLAGLMFR